MKNNKSIDIFHQSEYYIIKIMCPTKLKKLKTSVSILINSNTTKDGCRPSSFKLKNKNKKRKKTLSTNKRRINRRRSD